MSRLIRKSEILKITGLSYSTIWRLEKAGQFPKRRKVGSYSVAWLESEIKEWIASLEQK